jgi:RNA polymerase sigma factor for flagellar operon FliA
VQAGWIGAIDAVDKYAVTKGVLLEYYAKLRIRGAILDSMRDCDYISRDHRRDIKNGKAAAPVNCSIQARALVKDSSTHTFDIEDKKALREFGSVDASITALKLLRRADLSPQYQLVLLNYYWDQKTMAEIGIALKITESRVCQIHKEVISKTRAVLTPLS